VSELVRTVKGPAGVTTVKVQGTSIIPVTEGHSPTVPVGGVTGPGFAGTVGGRDKNKTRGLPPGLRTAGAATAVATFAAFR